MAYIAEWRVRETTETEGTLDLVLSGAMRGSLPFQNSAVMAVGDTCDYVVHYDAVFEAGLGTMGSDGKLQRTTVYRARHSNGDINTTKVSLPPGVKTVIMTVRASKILRVDVAQSLTQAERDQHCTNVGMPKSGDKALCPQATAWVGWTKDNSQHDAALRIVTDASGGGAGGSVNFSTLHARTSTDSFTIAQANVPSYNLQFPSGTVLTNVVLNQLYLRVLAGGPTDLNMLSPGTSLILTTNSTINVPSGGSGTALSANIDMRVKYRNVLVITKD